ncbi:MAG: Mbov_0121 family peptidase domain-containing ABC transporter [Metamycoplasmataceae bacterium]
MKIKLQKDKYDCGFVVIQAMHFYYYNKWIKLSTLKKDCDNFEKWISLKELSSISKKNGLLLENYEGDFDSLKELKNVFPIISLINIDGFKHFVIISKITKKSIIYFDPVEGKKILSHISFREIYENVIILCNKISFEKINIKQESFFKHIDFFSTIIIILTSLLIVVLSFISTHYFKIILDKIIFIKDKKVFLYLAIAFLLISFFKIILISIKNYLIKKIELKISYQYYEIYYDKIFNSNYLELSKINKSDFLKKYELISSIANFKANIIFLLTVEIITFLSSSYILLNLNFKIFLIILFSTFCYLIFCFFINKKTKKIYQENLKNAFEIQEKNYQLVNSLKDVKFFTKSLHYKNIRKVQEKSLHNFLSNFKLSSFIDFLNMIFKILFPILLIYFSVLEIFENNFSIGQVVLLISMFNYFIDPLEKFIILLNEIPCYKENIDNLDDILNLPDEKINSIEIKKINSMKLSPIYFHFNENKKILKIENFEINSSIILKGKNASGKSTFLLVLATILKANGNYFINNIDINNINIKNLRKKILYISPENYLPSCKIIDYLTNNEKVKLEIVSNNMDNHFQDILSSFNLTLLTNIEDNGSNFSFGQKQLVQLLPMLIYDYDLIILDEAFENIDYKNFDLIKKYMKNKNKNTIIIEVSHQNKYLLESKEVDFEKINKYK